ncbi:MAG: hypothetical protein AB7E08_02000 [Candidatus Omnitrophota bacterium]
MYSREEEKLSQELFKLEKLLRKTIFNSKEFKNLREKIEMRGMEMQVILLVMAKDKAQKEEISNNGKVLKLSAKDKEFLRKHGIKW